jgi:hypothetical protein
LGRVLFWRYQRGSWQYDILCGLILAFIFLTPKAVFDGSYFAQGQAKGAVRKTDQIEEKIASLGGEKDSEQRLGVGTTD